MAGSNKSGAGAVQGQVSGAGGQQGNQQATPANGSKHASGGTLYQVYGLPVLLRAGTVQAPLTERNGTRYGKQLGVRLVAFYNGIFDAIALGINATPNPQAIMAAVQAEFAGNGKWQSVASYASYYNGGKAGLGGPGLRVSLPSERRKPVPPTPPTAPQPAAPTKSGSK